MRAFVAFSESKSATNTRIDPAQKCNVPPPAGPDVVARHPFLPGVDLEDLEPAMRRQRIKPLGQVRTYGILVGKIQDGQMDPAVNSPHYEILVKADGDYRIAINVCATRPQPHPIAVTGGTIASLPPARDKEPHPPGEVMAFVDPEFASPTKLNLPLRAVGPRIFTPLTTGPGGQGLDYLRDRLFPIVSMTPIPDQGAGKSLLSLLQAQVERAAADDDAVLLACGELFQNDRSGPTFGISLERGLHDIHMMQGNSGTYADDNRVNGDGALFVRYGCGQTFALFLRFSAQGIQTDPRTGAPQ